jgi:hypothetical protein
MDVPVPALAAPVPTTPEQALLDHEDLMTDPEMRRQFLSGGDRPADQPGGAGPPANGC